MCPSTCLIIFHLTLIIFAQGCLSDLELFSNVQGHSLIFLTGYMLFLKLHEIWNTKKKKLSSTVTHPRHKMLLAGGHRESWQAQAENVKLLYSCHLRVSNEKDDIAQTGAPKQVMLVTGGQLHDFSIMCHPLPLAETNCHCQRISLPITAPVWVSIVTDIIIRMPRPACQAVIVVL